MIHRFESTFHPQEGLLFTAVRHNVFLGREQRETLRTPQGGTNDVFGGVSAHDRF
jgi:hypothetical protein